MTISGWGRGTWGEGAWNQAIPVVVTGVSATASAGTVTPVGSALHAPTGVAATGAVGNPALTGTALFSITGVAGTSALGDEQTNAGARVIGVGAVATISLGEEGVSGASLLSLTGVEGTAALSTGTVTFPLSIGVFPTGVTATGNTGIVLIYTEIVAAQTPNWGVVTGATTNWGDVAPSQTPSWTDQAA